MSKTVIVFSTRFISPLSNKGLFSKDNIKDPMPFSSDLLAKYFWDEFEHTKKKDFLEEMVLTDKYFTRQSLEELTETKELLTCLKKYKVQINNFIQTNPDIQCSTVDFEWVSKLLNKMRGDGSLGQEIIDSLTNNFKKFKDCLKDGKSLWICDHLRNDKEQKPLNIDIGNTNKREPWLTHRFSYYELKSNNNNDVKIYAVWPLENKCHPTNGQYQWVEALTDQFLNVLNPNAEKLFLILHDKDIADSIFKVIIDDTTSKTARHVALFQHIDAMGAFLEYPKDNSIKAVESFVERMIISARKRNLICDAYDYITSTDSNKSINLQNTVTKLLNLDKNKFAEISDIANKILAYTGADTNQYLDSLKLDLIHELNQQLKNVMTYEI